MRKSKKNSSNIWQDIGRGLLKHLPWALPSVIIATAYLIFFPEYTGGPDSSMLERFIFIFVVIGGYLAGLGGLALGPWGVAGSYLFVTLLALPQMLPDPWNRYFSVVYLAALFGGPSLYNYLKKKKGKKVPEEAVPPVPDDWEEEAVDFSQGIFVLRNLNGRVYQLVRCSGQLRAYRVGGELKGLYEGQAVDPANPRPVCEKDLVFPLDTIRSLKITEHNLYGITVHIKGKKNWNCNPYLTTTPEALEAFVRKALPQAVSTPAPETPDNRPEFVKRRAKLKKIRTGLLVALGLVYLPWLFLEVPYKLFSILSLLLFSVIAAFSFGHHKDITLSDNKRSGKVEMVTPLLFAGIPGMLRSSLDYDFVQWKPVLLWTAGIGALLVFVFLLFLPESRKKISQIFTIAVICLFFAFHATAQLNFLLDFKDPFETAAVITDMHISTSSKGPDSYYLTVALPDGKEMKIRTYEEHYNAVSVGDNSTVLTCSGGLEIPYVFVK